ncbi:unnamed protein product [Linum tenue]|uniref:Leucine-rich repeat-containing N-terminal plant-type domain-containing protein n=1 Tax=Linum tenue TaxID=586396 RepID=A0AAV0MN67_9ROSI|nr:unnamed protein product [Linum tenue]
MASWNEGTDCCSWEGVTCDSSTGRVVDLDISCQQMDGSSPPDVGYYYFPHLRGLNLAYNHFNGSTISSAIAKLTDLTRLNLSHTGFSGEIPSEFSHLKKLVSLDLSFNQVAFVRDEDYSNVLSNATNLSELWLQEGKFPESVFRLPCMESIRLKRNKDLLVQLPRSNWSAASLKVLEVSSTNCFGKMLPDSIGNLKSLRVLSLDEVGFIGNVPSSICNLTSLTSLDLSHNSFSGEFPHTVSNLVQLETLHIQYNNFTGHIPSSIFNLPNLQWLGCSDNQLVGPIPSEIVHSSLHSVYLNNNFLNGTIPSWLLALPSMEILGLSYNQLTGEIPEIQSSSLRYIYLDHNRLSGLAPTSSTTLKGWNNLQWMDLNSNELSGTMPSYICYLASLLVIDLSNNNLSGSIPECLFNLAELSVLNLRNNNFHGPIPSSMFGNMSKLTHVDLNGNKLGGSLPAQSLATCKMLEVLDVGNNNVDDVFPQWLSNLPSLKVLILGSNSFHGAVTTSNSFSMLQILDLSNNYFNGSLPAGLFHKFPAMKMLKDKSEEVGTEYYIGLVNYKFSFVLTVKGKECVVNKFPSVFTTLDMSNNYFRGEIPDAIGELGSLLFLNLSHNNFVGPIPSSLGNMRELESLDLSSNRLSRKIPSQLTSLTYLSFLNLSRNSLVGPIPQGNQFGTFDAASYAGNEGLCGVPLSKKCGGDDEDGDHDQDSEPELESGGELFSWGFAGAGYGCGLVIGISTAYIMFSTRKPEWLVEIVENWTWRG